MRIERHSSKLPRLELTVIESELARTSLRVGFANLDLELAYGEAHREAARPHNRFVICILVAVFNAYILSERHSLPESLGVSALLRFGVLTPVTLIYVLLDWRGVIAKWNAPVVTALLIAPTLLACIQSLWVSSPLALANYQALPLIQLTVLTCRLGLRQAAVVDAVSCLLFAATILHAPFVPPALHVSLITTDLAIGLATLVFAWRLDVRDRQVFLFTHQAAMARDVLAGQNRRLAQLSQVDALTGLGNRRCFDDALAALWAPGAAHRWPVCLIMFDIDCFKPFNDLLGHQAGDECLAALARAVRVCLRDERDILVRYGGEEFALILPQTALREGAAIAERLRLAVLDRGLPHPGGAPMHLVTISLGMAEAGTPAQSAASLIEAADRALYVAKRLGRNRVACDGDPPEAAESPGLRLAFSGARRGTG